MLINVQLPGVQAEHAVGIAPYKVSETHCVEYHLIDGSHLLRQPVVNTGIGILMIVKRLFLVFVSFLLQPGL